MVQLVYRDVTERRTDIIKQLTRLLVLASISYGFFSPTIGATGNLADPASNNILPGGAPTIADLRNAYNTSSDAKSLYTHTGLTNDIVSQGTVHVGTVTKSGNVMDGSNIVATNAQSIGRMHLDGSREYPVGGTTYFIRPTNVSFRSDNLPAYLFYNSSNQLRSIALADCGNPIIATPVPGPTPSYTCDSLYESGRISSTKRAITMKATASHGAHIQSYTFNLGDGTIRTVATSGPSATIHHEYANPGIYTISGTVSVNADSGMVSTPISQNCSTTIVLAPPTVTTTASPPTVSTQPRPQAPKQPPAELPRTGSIDVLASMLSIGSVATSSYYYAHSRRRLTRETLRHVLRK